MNIFARVFNRQESSKASQRIRELTARSLQQRVGYDDSGEAVRLVIWDLDETFWHGTLTEGGISFDLGHRDIVIELARRGIVSAICSKNELRDVEAVLRQHDVWDYFVFPSVNWEPKGPRIRQLIEDVQLRPETVMFIDDNPSNLNEALALSPKLQVAPETIVGSLLHDRRFKGKDDSALSRLDQYKLLEKRKRDEAATGGDNRAFLRSSNIRVHLDFDIANNLDRVVELIDRTNQLNYIKDRLPEDADAAKTAVLGLTASYGMHAALVRVIDNYGDHGYCGLYVYRSGDHRLQQFCFSCRILGMEIERWLYRRLGSPKIDVKGEVLSDLFAEGDIDWVREIASLDEHSARSEVAEKIGQVEVVLRGDCSLQAIGHYLKNACGEFVDEMVAIRNDVHYKRQHSVFLKKILDGVTPEEMKIAESLGFIKQDFETVIFSKGETQKVVMLSFTDDGFEPIYRHKETGLIVCIHIPAAPGHFTWDLTTAPMEAINERCRTEATGEIMRIIREDSERVGGISNEDFASNVTAILDAIDPETKVFINVTSDATELFGEALEPAPNHLSRIVLILRQIAAGRANVRLISPDPHMQSREDFGNGDRAHYSRMVYFRMYNEIVDAVAGDMTR